MPVFLLLRSKFTHSNGKRKNIFLFTRTFEYNQDDAGFSKENKKFLSISTIHKILSKRKIFVQRVTEGLLLTDLWHLNQLHYR